jgi:hypothetical protein
MKIPQIPERKPDLRNPDIVLAPVALSQPDHGIRAAGHEDQQKHARDHNAEGIVISEKDRRSHHHQTL